MSSSATLQADLRKTVGSRSARKLRREGRIPCSLQAVGDQVHINLSIVTDDFLKARRQHVHLFDLSIGSDTETAVVRELQWDAMGDYIAHVEFKRVQRGVKTESEVELRFVGQVKEGVLTHSITHIPISSIPSLIPDDIEVNVDGLTAGAHIKAADLVLPEGVSLALDPQIEIAVVSALRAEMEEKPEEEEGGEEVTPE